MTATPHGALTRYAAPLLGLLAGGAFLYTAFRTVSFADVTRSLQHGTWLPAAPAILVGVVLFIVAKARRWRALLGDPVAITTGSLVRPVAVGLLFNSLVAHSGEFARALTLQRAHGLPVSGVLVGIAVERLFDFLIVLLFGLIAGGYADVPAGLVPALRIVGLFSLGLGAGVALALVAPVLLRRLVVVCTGWWPARPRGWLLAQVDHALEGLAPLRAAHRLPVALGWSAVQWSAIVWCIYFCARVPGIGLSAPQAALVLIAVVVVFTLPDAPGYLGSTQVAFLAVLAPLGVPKDAAIAASFVYTLVVVVPLMVSGALALVFPARPARPAPGAPPG